MEVMYIMFFLGRIFCVCLLCTLKPKNPLKIDWCVQILPWIHWWKGSHPQERFLFGWLKSAEWC